MDLRQARLISDDNAPSPENDRRWISRFISERAQAGFYELEIRDYKSMPGGGSKERFEDVLNKLQDEGFKVKQSSNLGGSFRIISW